MEYRVIVEKPVSRALGAYIGGKRGLLVRVLTRLHDELTHRAETHRPQRDPEDTDLFRYSISLAEGTSWHTFWFWVNDVRAQGILFVEAVKCEPGRVS